MNEEELLNSVAENATSTVNSGTAKNILEDVDAAINDFIEAYNELNASAYLFHAAYEKYLEVYYNDPEILKDKMKRLAARVYKDEI